MACRSGQALHGHTQDKTNAGMDQVQKRLLRKHGDSDIRTDQSNQEPDVVLDAGGFFGGPVHGCVEAFARSATQQSSCDTAPMKKGVANLKKYRQTTKNTRKYKNDDKGQNAICKDILGQIAQRFLQITLARGRHACTSVAEARVGIVVLINTQICNQESKRHELSRTTENMEKYKKCAQDIQLPLQRGMHAYLHLELPRWPW